MGESIGIEQLRAGTRYWTERMLVQVGRQLHEGRVVTPDQHPTTDPEYPEGFDEGWDITFEPIHVEVDGVRIVAKPRRIGVREVAAYAKTGCRRCHGVGYFRARQRRKVLGPSGQPGFEDFEFEKTCTCAEKRYTAEHPLMVADTQMGEWIALDDLHIDPVG